METRRLSQTQRIQSAEALDPVEGETSGNLRGTLVSSPGLGGAAGEGAACVCQTLDFQSKGLEHGVMRQVCIIHTPPWRVTQIPQDGFQNNDPGNLTVM